LSRVSRVRVWIRVSVRIMVGFSFSDRVGITLPVPTRNVWNYNTWGSQHVRADYN